MSLDFYQDAKCYDLFEGEFATGNFLDFYVRQIGRYGDYLETKFTTNSPKQLIVCRKR